MAVGDRFDHVPLGVGIEGLLDVGGIEELEERAQEMPDFLRQCENVAIAGAVEGKAQIGADALDGGNVSKRPVLDVLRATDHLANRQITEILSKRAVEGDELE